MRFLTQKELITVEEIIAIHEEIIESKGGVSGILNIGELEFAVDWVNNSLNKTLFWKIAFLLRSIVCGHPFVDGNKRTGFMIMYTILDDYGYEFITSRENIKEFIVELATKEKSINDIIEWIDQNTNTK